MTTKTQLIKSKYELVELIREDIISLCYRGATHYSKHPLLIWEYKAEYLNSSLVTRLINLSEKLIQFQSPNVLTMIDYYYDGKSFYVVYEGPASFVSLDTYLKQVKKVDLNQLWSFASQLLTVLLKFEQAGLCCGNINFSDIVVTSDQKILLSRSTLPLEIYKQNKADLVVIEDCVFLAPEFILNGSYSSSSDMYSFAVLLFVFFSQKWPFKYSIIIDQMKKEIVKGPLKFEPIHERIPDRLGKMISVCLKPDPENRFRSFVELIKVYRGDMDFSQHPTKEESGVRKRLDDYLNQKKLDKTVLWVKRALVVITIIVSFFVCQKLYISYITSLLLLILDVIVYHIFYFINV